MNFETPGGSLNFARGRDNRDVTPIAHLPEAPQATPGYFRPTREFRIDHRAHRGGRAKKGAVSKARGFRRGTKAPKKKAAPITKLEESDGSVGAIAKCRAITSAEPPADIRALYFLIRLRMEIDGRPADVSVWKRPGVAITSRLTRGIPPRERHSPENSRLRRIGR